MPPTCNTADHTLVVLEDKKDKKNNYLFFVLLAFLVF